MTHWGTVASYTKCDDDDDNESDHGFANEISPFRGKHVDYYDNISNIAGNKIWL